MTTIPPNLDIRSLLEHGCNEEIARKLYAQGEEIAIFVMLQLAALALQTNVINGTLRRSVFSRKKLILRYFRDSWYFANFGHHSKMANPEAPKDLKMKKAPKTTPQQTTSPNTNDIKTIIKELFPECLFDTIKTNAGGFWKPSLLAATAFLWMICGDATIVVAFHSAFDILLACLPPLEKTKASYQGFTGQLAKDQAQLMRVIIPHLRNLTKSKLEKYWHIGKGGVITADGTRASLARNKNLQQNFVPSKKKRKQRSTAWRKKYTVAKKKKRNPSAVWGDSR